MSSYASSTSSRRAAHATDSSAAGLVALWVTGLIVVVLVAIQGLFYKDVLLDDPFISFRYAQHLVEGHGLVWNPGEDPVEGFTSFLWTLAAAGGIALGFHPLAFVKVLGWAASLVLALLPLTPLNRFHRTWVGRCTAALLLASCPLLVFYGLSGMEQTAFALLVAVAVLLQLRATESGGLVSLKAAALLGLATLLRPEGLGVFGIIVLFAVAHAAVGGRPGIWRSIAVACGLYAAVWLPFLAWRLSYFGYPFPNTYYAKHTGGGIEQWASGLQYLIAGAHLYMAAPLAFAAAAVWLARREAAVGLAFLGWFVVAYAGYIVLVGGDDTAAFPSVRLFVPLLPVAYLLAARATELLPRPVVAGVLVLALTSVGFATDGQRLVAAGAPALRLDAGPMGLLSALATPRGTTYAEPPLSRWIREHTAPDALIAVPWAGAVSYYSKRRVVDTLGLNDEHIAHLPKRQRGIDVKMDPDYVLSRRPELIFVNVDKAAVLAGRPLEHAGAWKIGDREMIERLKASPAYALDTHAPTHVLVYRRQGP